MNVRIVVADGRQANFFDAGNPGGPWAQRGSLHNETAGMKDTDLETDRAGRRFGGTAGHHHGVDGERSTERHELTNFAREVAQNIEAARVAHEFDRLVIVAGPRMLGLLREELPQPCREVLAAEVTKDLPAQDTAAIREAVPREVFWN
jgi:protein required for attachment to host cells